MQDLSAISYLSSLSQYGISILAYIGRYIIRVLSKSLLCKTCCHAFVKDQRGLLHLSEDVLKILQTCEVVFKTVVSGAKFQVEVKRYGIMFIACNAII